VVAGRGHSMWAERTQQCCGRGQRDHGFAAEVVVLIVLAPAIDDPCTGLWVPPHFFADSLSQCLGDSDEGAIKGPLVEVVSGRVPVGEIGGQEPPLTPRPSQMEQRVDHLPKVDDGRATHDALTLHQGADHLPLLVRKVGRITVSRGWNAVRHRCY